MEDFQNLLQDIFNENQGRVPKMEMMMLWFPKYLKKYFTLHMELMNGNGPLAIEERHFLALLAVSTYGCDYLFLRLKQ